MRTCEYCGYENDGAFTRCQGCGTEFIVPTADLNDYEPFRPLWVKLKRRVFILCGFYPQRFLRRAPIFGIIAVSAPFICFPVAVEVAKDFLDFLGVILLILMLGGFAGFLGLLRGEKYRALGFAGLIVDILIPIAWLLLGGLLRTR